jgi:hypothetical protein
MHKSIITTFPRGVGDQVLLSWIKSMDIVEDEKKVWLTMRPAALVLLSQE